LIKSPAGLIPSRQERQDIWVCISTRVVEHINGLKQDTEATSILHIHNCPFYRIPEAPQLYITDSLYQPRHPALREKKQVFPVHQTRILINRVAQDGFIPHH
jgi:hypothetical protein